MPKGMRGFQKGHKGFLKKHSENSKRKISESRMGNKNPNWKGGKPKKICFNCGNEFPSYRNIYCSRICADTSLSHRKKISKASSLRIGKKASNWKGNKAKYHALHERVRIKRGEPNFCEICKTSEKGKRYEWANLTGRYTDVMDYKRMCCSCHTKYDNEKRKLCKI